MNCSLSCLRRLLGMFSRGITNRSRGGTWSPISCISPSTAHHSDLSSTFFSGSGGDLGGRRLEWGPVVASVRGERSWWDPRRRKGVTVRAWSRFFARESIGNQRGVCCWLSASNCCFFQFQAQIQITPLVTGFTFPQLLPLPTISFVIFINYFFFCFGNDYCVCVVFFNWTTVWLCIPRNILFFVFYFVFFPSKIDTKRFLTWNKHF